jgi:hypothetical protein
MFPSIRPAAFAFLFFRGHRLDRRLLLVVPGDATQSNAKRDKIGA